MIGWLKKRFAPQMAPGSREHAERVLSAANEAYEAYKLARRDRPREHYQPSGYSGDAAILGSHNLMNRRVRDLVRNTAQGKTIVRAFANLIVGRGVQTFAWPFLPSEILDLTSELETVQAGDLGPRLSYALEADDLFETYYHDKKQFDIEGRLSGPEMYRMLLSETVSVGNGLLVRAFRKDYDPDTDVAPVAWQLFEREQLDESLDRDASEGRNKIVGGLEIDRRNRVVAYHLFLDHPYDYFGVSQASNVSTALGGRSMRIPAERVIDLALYDRPSSSLGASWLDASGQSIWDRDSYSESELRVAAVESVFAVIAKLNDGEQYGAWGFGDDQDDNDDHGNRLYKVGHSPVASVIGTNESIEMVKPQRPNKDAASFIKVIDRDTSSAAGLSYYTLTGDYEGTNFTSTRAAKLDEELALAPLQQWFAFNVALPIRQIVNTFAIAGGRIRSVSPAEFKKNQRRYQRFDFIGSGRDLLDPFKEGEARTGRLRTGISTYKEECARAGKHWIRVLMQHSIEKKVFELFDVSPDWSKPGAGDQTQSMQEETDDTPA